MKKIIIVLCSIFILACGEKSQAKTSHQFPTGKLQVGVIIREPAYITFYVEDEIGKTRGVQSNGPNHYLYDKKFVLEFTKIAHQLYGKDLFTKSVKQNLLPALQQCKFDIKILTDNYYNFEMRKDLSFLEKRMAENSISSSHEAPEHYAQNIYFKLKTVPQGLDYVFIIDGDLEYNAYKNIPKNPLSIMYGQMKRVNSNATVGYRPKAYVQAELYDKNGLPVARFRAKQTGETEKREKYIFSSQQDVIAHAPDALKGLLEYNTLAMQKLAREMCANHH